MLFSDFLGCKNVMFHGKKWKNEVSQQKKMILAIYVQMELEFAAYTAYTTKKSSCQYGA